jgi:hypothetical protein
MQRIDGVLGGVAALGFGAGFEVIVDVLEEQVVGGGIGHGR